MAKYPIAGPSITQREVDLVNRAIREAWYENAGKFVREFEKKFAEHTGRRHAVATNSCTAAIHLALAASGIGPGDEVIVPDLTWIASVAPVVYCGATPIFADSDPNHWCVAPATVGDHIGPKTRAIVAVDLYGNMPELGELETLAHTNNLILIEDAAEALGSERGGRPAGNFGDVSVFSFHGSKTLTTGEGGMLVTDDENIYQRVCKLRDHGRRPGIWFYNDEVAYKYKMTDLQAALGLAQLERLDELISIKRSIFDAYRKPFAKFPELRMNPEPPDVFNSAWMSTIVWPASWALDKNKLIDALIERGIDTRPIFYPLSSLPAFQNYCSDTDMRHANPNAYAIGFNGLNLPSAASLCTEDIDSISKEVIAAIQDERTSPASN